MVGRAIMGQLRHAGYLNLLHNARRSPDLFNQKEVEDYLEFQRPEVIVVTAGLVGGILANKAQPVEFLVQNLRIAINVIQSAARGYVEKLLYLGSSCIYPRQAPQPMQPEHLLTGPLEPTNEAYALSKIVGIRLCQYHRREYKRNFITAMPCNLYGPGDTYDDQKSHVIPALIHKFDQAKRRGSRTITCLGDGSAQREFLYVHDLASAVVTLLEQYDGEEIVNIGSGQAVKIIELAEQVKKTVGYTGNIGWTGQTNGMPVKIMDSSVMRAMGWDAKVSLPMGLQLAYEDYKTRFVAQTEERLD